MSVWIQILMGYTEAHKSSMPSLWWEKLRGFILSSKRLLGFNFHFLKAVKPIATIPMTAATAMMAIRVVLLRPEVFVVLLSAAEVCEGVEAVLDIVVTDSAADLVTIVVLLENADELKGPDSVVGAIMVAEDATAVGSTTAIEVDIEVEEAVIGAAADVVGCAMMVVREVESGSAALKLELDVEITDEVLAAGTSELEAVTIAWLLALLDGDEDVVTGLVEDAEAATPASIAEIDERVLLSTGAPARTTMILPSRWTTERTLCRRWAGWTTAWARVRGRRV